MTLDPMVLGLAAGGVVLLLVVLIVSGSTFISIVVVLFLLGIVFYVLTLLGVISFDVKDDTIDVNFRESSPAPAPTKQVLLSDVKGVAAPIQKKEVFYVSGNEYTYDDAQLVAQRMTRNWPPTSRFSKRILEVPSGVDTDGLREVWRSTLHRGQLGMNFSVK